jgi:hypothetical protein
MLARITTTAITRKTWMKLPRGVEKTNPTSHKKSRTTAIVHNMAIILSLFGLVFSFYG